VTFQIDAPPVGRSLPPWPTARPLRAWQQAAAAAVFDYQGDAPHALSWADKSNCLIEGVEPEIDEVKPVRAELQVEVLLLYEGAPVASLVLAQRRRRLCGHKLPVGQADSNAAADGRAVRSVRVAHLDGRSASAASDQRSALVAYGDFEFDQAALKRNRNICLQVRIRSRL
jgi:hypothetical protein